MNKNTEEFLQKLASCIERGGLDACVEEAARVAREPQIPADKHRYVVPVICPSLVIIDTNQQNNHFFAPFGYFAYSVVDCLCKYSFFQKKLKNLTNSANPSKPAIELPPNILDKILKAGVNLP
jgi:hypothetical protein